MPRNATMMLWNIVYRALALAHVIIYTGQSNNVHSVLLCSSMLFYLSIGRYIATFKAWTSSVCSFVPNVSFALVEFLR